jgi:hypothetical protein
MGDIGKEDSRKLQSEVGEEFGEEYRESEDSVSAIVPKLHS